jgi:hypothetical protein
MNLSIDCNAEKVALFVMDIAEKQIPFATLRTLSQLASKTRKAVYDEMDLVLELPLKRFTLQAMGVTPATFESGPVSKVFLKDDPLKRQDKAFGHLFRGGERRWKNMEGALLRKNLMPPGMYAVPGEACPIDRYGNIPPSFVRSILSYFQALNEGNMLQKTKTLKSNKKKDPKTGFMRTYGKEYFISFGSNRMAARVSPKTAQMYQQYQHLAAGIYSRTGTHGVDISPIIMFVPKKRPYRKYIDLPLLGERVLNQNKEQFFAQNLAEAIAGSKVIKRMMDAAD